MTTNVLAEAPTQSDQPRTSRRWLGLAVLAVAQFMVVLDATIVNIALPDVGRGLHIANGGLAWVITAYVIAFGGLLPLGGRLADLLGRRRMFIAGVGLFSASSLAAGLAQNAATLVATRAVQGAGAAMLAPAALALVTATFPVASDRAKALGIWGAVSAGGSAAGVLLGGLLTGQFGWRSVFLINVPIGIAVLAVIRGVVRESIGHRPRQLKLAHLDLPGALAATGGIATLVTGLSQTNSRGFTSAAVLSWFAVAAVLLATFLLIESRSDNPLVPLRLFGLRTVSAGNTVMLLTGAAMFGLFYFLSLYEQIVLGYGPVAAGTSQLPLALVLIVAAGVAAPLMARIGTRTVLAMALVIFAGGLAWMGFAPVGGTFTADLLGPTLLIGVGLGMAFVPVTHLAVSGIPAHDAGIASGLVNTSQQVGGAIGLAALSALASARTTTSVHHGAQPMPALLHGYSWAFYAAAAIAVAAAAITAATVRRHDTVDVNHATAAI